MDKEKNIENENRNYEESRIYDKTNINNKIDNEVKKKKIIM